MYIPKLRDSLANAFTAIEKHDGLKVKVTVATSDRGYFMASLGDHVQIDEAGMTRLWGAEVTFSDEQPKGHTTVSPVFPDVKTTVILS